jgi:hypothetical protein
LTSDTYCLCDVRVRVELPSRAEADRLRGVWERLFELGTPQESFPGRRLSLRFLPVGRPAAEPPEGEPLFQSRELRGWKTPAGFHLRLDRSCLDLDCRAGRALGSLQQDFWQLALADLRDFFLLCFVMLLRKHGLYGLHANGLVRGHAGTLVVGPSGSGKTTLSVALISAGWQFVGDDALALNLKDEVVGAHALRRGFSCTPRTAAGFPELRMAVAQGGELVDGKRHTDLGSVYGDRFVPQCTPRLLLFPELAGGTRSRLEPIPATRAMTSLLEQSPGILTDRPGVEAQLALLRRLLEQASCRRIELGNDVYQAPHAVSELIRGSLDG